MPFAKSTLKNLTVPSSQVTEEQKELRQVCTEELDEPTEADEGDDTWSLNSENQAGQSRRMFALLPHRTGHNN